MSSYGLSFVLVVLVVQKCAVYVQGQITKSSLTFVIDDTASMWDEINQVKEEVNIIFEKVLSSKSSQIENFIIVTFNDPGAELLTITKDRNVFKNALASIDVHSFPNNTHCPEEAMTGIELGLTSSLPLSYIYVFTDAKARDYYKFNQIKSISQKKQSQVVFLLTGDCGQPSGPDYQVYHQLAQATGGQVFHIVKDDVKDILKYIEESITGRGVAIVNKKYPPGTHRVKFTVDAHTGDVLISLTGLGSRIGAVTGPGGIRPPVEPIVSGKAKMAVKRLRNLTPGDYEVIIEGKAEIHIIMFAKSDINFQLGFSIDSPTSIKDTVTRPPPEGSTFLGARLLGDGVELTSVRITDLDNNIIEELPLTIVDKKEQFYITPSFNSPSTMFLVTVVGKDLKTGTPVIRTGPTPIARQDPTAEPAVNTAPEVTIQGAPKIIAEHDDVLTLKCNVHGYPAPNIIWSEKDTGIVMPAKVQTRDVPYDYFSSLEIKKTNENITYECKASNGIGTTSKYVEVERKPYFDVIEAPKDIRVEYTKEGSIVCKIDAYPPATVTWYKDGAVFVGDTNVDVSSDQSTLTIKSMQPELKGKYSCEAKSDIDRKVFIVDVDIFGVEEPVIDKSHEVQCVLEKTNAELSCRTLKGIPKPTISWSFKPMGTTSFVVMTETTETVQLKEVRQDQTGTYQCIAKNALGSDSFTMELIVEYPPTVKVDEKVKQIKNGEKVKIPCDVTGEPTPTVQWFFKGSLLASSSKILISSDNSIEFIATPADNGDYTCEAKNKLDTAKITVSLDVLEAPVIDKPPKEKRVTEKTDYELSCRILRGNPKPTISWSFKAVGTTSFVVMTETTETVQLKKVRQDQTGTYQCIAKNALGSDSFTMKLIVEYPPTVKVDEKVKQIKNGEKVRIPCDVTGEPTPTVQWFFKGSLLASSSKIRILSDNSIEFIATPADNGDYTCEAKNKLDTEKITVSLDVLEAPVIDKPPKEKRVTEKTDYELSCRILRGNPKPTISWSFKAVGTTSFVVMTETTETVQLKKVRQDQTGTYQCIAKNALGSDSFTMKLIVEYPPTVKVDEKVKQIKNGEKVRIPCDVTGEPTPTVQWFFKGSLLASSSKIRILSDNSIEFIATPADNGDYTCEAKNKLDTEKITVSLDVLEAPVIDKPTKEKRVTEKTDYELSCRILRGNPKPTISWSFKAVGTTSFVVMTETTESVQLKKVRQDQTGTYQCIAKNALGSDSFTMKLIVEYPPTVKVDEKVKQIKNGEKVRIPCDVTGEPTPTVQWFFKGSLLASSSKILKSSDNSIEFIATPADNGDYTCEAKNKLDTEKITVSLDVLEAPVIDKPPKEKRVTEKTDYELSCRILRGNPKPTISWSFKAVGTTSFVVMTETTETVQLKKVRQDQTGTYQCIAKNALGSDSFTMKLIVEYPPTVKVDEKVKQIKNGEKVKIPCDVTGEPTPTVQWFFKGSLLASSSKIRILSDNSIEFIATPADNGDYTCEAKNKLDTEKITVSLDVLEAPVIDKPPKEKRVTEKTDYELSCRILRGNPKPTISWSFKAVGTTSFVVMTETTETVQLKKVRQDQTGTYQCIAKNALGSDSFTMKLIVEYPPTVKVDEKVKQIKNGEKVKIPCDVTGEPTPTVQWFFKGILLASSSKIRISSDHSIEFVATPSDNGDYTCEAKNKLDTAKITVSLDVLEVPEIDKTTKVKRVKEKTNTALSCEILRGNPKPSISWSFKPVGAATSKAMKQTTEKINLKKVRRVQTGTYECTAENTQGSDSYAIELIVEYRPVIKSDVKLKQVKDDDEVTISCDVTGEPVPTVTWFFNGAKFESAAKSLSTSDNSLRFKARIADIGSYRCEATNKLGSATKTTKLKVYVPVTIETPKDSNIGKMVGKSHILECQADGYPKPNIKWTFQSSDPKIPAKDVTPTGGAASLVLKNLQLNQQGLYTCDAENGIGGSDSITYDVKVYAPPAIVNKYPFKNFEAVKGDVALRIQCNTTGSPKPSIFWMKDGLNVAKETEWYDIEDDGTLIIKNVDSTSEGSYVCRAENILGNVTELYEVTVREISVPLTPTTTIYVKEGETVPIDCGIPHSKTDQMRWYKDSLVVASGELTLYSVTRSDDGLYTCRVSNPAKSRSVTTKVVVGFKPEFSTVEPDTIAFFHGAAPEILSCEAIGQPKPTTAIWKHNGKTLGFTDMSYPLGMVYGATGMYECEVSNAFGSIRRTFNVTSRACILDIKEDFPKKKQPLMLSRALTWPEFAVEDGYMIIPNADFFYMICPSKFSNPVLPPYNFTAFCEGDNTIKINGNLYKFADIQCNKEVEPEVSKTGISCLPGNTEYVHIGFKIFDDFLGVFDVCLDKDNNVPLFTKHKLSPDHTDRSTEATWSNIQLPQDFDSLYDCSRQMYDITSTLGRGLSTRESCCFGKRQLVSSHDLAPDIPPSSTYDYLNVIPHWSTCSSKNWEDVEQSVRKLAKSTRSHLVISTGTATPLHGVASTVITLHDGFGEKQAVAPYLWKVVQDPVQAASLAIIQINIPDLSAAEARKHVRCPNYCGGGGINWLKPSNWQTVEDGYTYCCSITDFENAFGYIGRFSPGKNNLLIDGSL